MQLTGFELFAFLLCSSLFGLLFSTWATTHLINDRELTLLIVTYAAIVFALLAKLSRSRAINILVNKDGNEIHEKQLADVKEAQRRHINVLKKEHAKAVLLLDTSLAKANSQCSQLYHEHDFLSSLYQDQVRLNGEQEDRINYLEKKLQEFGQSTPVIRAPFSAPPTQVTFADPPRRQQPTSSSMTTAMQGVSEALEE